MLSVGAVYFYGSFRLWRRRQRYKLDEQQVARACNALAQITMKCRQKRKSPVSTGDRANWLGQDEFAVFYLPLKTAQLPIRPPSFLVMTIVAERGRAVLAPPAP